MLDLQHNLYDIKVLEQHIYIVNLLDLLKYQKLTSDFIVMYILNKDFQLTKEEENITLTTVLSLQPHIRYADIQISYSKNINMKNIPNFEAISLLEQLVFEMPSIIPEKI